MKQMKLWQWIFCLAFLAFHGSSVFAKAVDDYLPWNQAMDYQKVLYQAARESRIDVDPQFVQEFNHLLDTDNNRLLPWARKIDDWLERIERKNREFSQEFSQLQYEQKSLEQEKTQHRSQSHVEDLNRRIYDYNDRFYDAERRLATHQRDVDAYNDEVLNRYNPEVLAWQTRVKAFRKKQMRERQRLLDKLRQEPEKTKIPDPSSLKPRIVSEKAAKMVVETVTAPLQVNLYAQKGAEEAVGWARKNPEKAKEVTKQVVIIGGLAAAAYITKNPAVVRTLATAISIEQTAEEITEGALEKEVRRVKKDEDKARKLGDYFKKLNKYRKELKESGISETEITEKMLSKQEELRKDLPKSFKDQDYRLLENMINKKTGKIVLKEIALQVLARGIAKKLDPEVKIPSAEDHKAWLDKMHQKPQDTTKLLMPE